MEEQASIEKEETDKTLGLALFQFCPYSLPLCLEWALNYETGEIQYTLLVDNAELYTSLVASAAIHFLCIRYYNLIISIIRWLL